MSIQELALNITAHDIVDWALDDELEVSFSGSEETRRAYDSLKTLNMVEGVGLQMELKGGDIIFAGPTDVLDELSEEIDNHWM